jgi:hypothetical protein
MSKKEILKEISLLSAKERIWLMEQTLKSLRHTEVTQEMSMAADALAVHYRTDKELTAFTDIDFEHFYEPRGNMDHKS